MVIKTRRMARDNWNRVISREYRTAEFARGELHGVVGMLRFGRVREPLKVAVGRRLVQIVGSGYYWLQIAPEGEHWWQTAMFDPSMRVLEYYFDVTLENTLDGAESSFRDLFLDVVVAADGSPYLLDEEELDAALAEGVITPEEHALSHETAAKLLDAFPARINELERFCIESLRQLSQ